MAKAAAKGSPITIARMVGTAAMVDKVTPLICSPSMGGKSGDPEKHRWLCATAAALAPLRREPDHDTDGRAAGVETVIQEGRDDVPVDHHQRQRLPAAVVRRDAEALRLDIHRIGVCLDPVRHDGRGNLLRNVGSHRDIALGGHCHVVEGRSARRTGAKHRMPKSTYSEDAWAEFATDLQVSS